MLSLLLLSFSCRNNGKLVFPRSKQTDEQARFYDPTMLFSKDYVSKQPLSPLSPEMMVPLSRDARSTEKFATKFSKRTRLRPPTGICAQYCVRARTALSAYLCKRVSLLIFCNREWSRSRELERGRSTD